MQSSLSRKAIQAALPAALCVLATSAAAVAAPTTDPPSQAGSSAPSPGFTALEPFHAWIGVQSGVAWLDSATAQRNHMGRAGATLYHSLGVGVFDLVTASASLGSLFPGDRASFSEDVAPLLRSRPPAHPQSGLQVTNYSVELGLRTPSFCLLLATGSRCLALHAFLNYGRATLNALRFIAHCQDCATQDIDLHSGSFLEPGLALGIPSGDEFGLDVRAAYRRFAADSALESEVRIGFALLFL
jgi:hypothetical protein